MRARRFPATGGFVVPAAVSALILFAMYVGYLMYASRGELNLTARRIKQERARVVAESAVEAARALVFQNDFDNRWYKQQKVKAGRYGFTGEMKGTLGGGTFRVVAEDVTNTTEGLGSGDYGWIASLTYNRIDLFSEGWFDDTKVIVYRSLYWHPEQKVFAWDVESVAQSDGTTKEMWTNIHVR